MKGERESKIVETEERRTNCKEDDEKRKKLGKKEKKTERDMGRQGEGRVERDKESQK